MPPSSVRSEGTRYSQRNLPLYVLYDDASRNRTDCVDALRWVTLKARSIPSASISSIFTDSSGSLRARPHSHALRLIVPAILPLAPINAAAIDVEESFSEPKKAGSLARQ